MASLIQRWKDELGKRYRAVIMEDESLFETGSYRYTKGRLLMLFLLTFFFTVALSITAVFYTPWIRQMIPGYSREDEYQKQQELLRKVTILEDALVQRDSFLASLQRMSGDPSGMPAKRPPAVPVEEMPDFKAESHTDHDHSHEMEHGEEPTTSPAYTGTRALPAQQVVIGARKVPALPGTLRLIPPVDGVVTSAYSPADRHFGMDLAAPANALIRSVADGMVIYSEWSDQSGYVVAVLHPGGLVSLYKHNRVVFKTAGTPVYAGEAIAVIGNTGKNSTGPHLHFELWHGGNPVNPLDYFALN
jgi:hypothetical protein